MPQTVERPIESAGRRPATRGNPVEGTVVPLEIDPLEELYRLAEAYCRKSGLTADQAIERILAEVRGK